MRNRTGQDDSDIMGHRPSPLFVFLASTAVTVTVMYSTAGGIMICSIAMFSGNQLCPNARLKGLM